jgi:hypothetical protein
MTDYPRADDRPRLEYPFSFEESYVMVRGLMVLVGITAFLATAPADAQQAVLSQLYGEGVHAYFAGDYRLAQERLSAAVDAGTQDPRVFYFRGLADRMLGRPQEAAADFQRGARLETQDRSRNFNVAQALERVQGEARMQLETYRIVARKSALKAANQMRQSRFEALKREEQRVLLMQVEAAKMPAEIIATPAALEEKAEAPKISDTSVETKAPGGTAKPGTGNATEEGNENPFVQSPAAAQAPKAPEKNAEKPREKSKIFGALRNAVEKTLIGGAKAPAGPPLPFGPGKGAAPPVTQPPSDSNPFGEPSGETPAPPAKKTDKPAGETPAGENPFGEEPAAKKAPENKSAPKSTSENPFQ